MALRLGGRYLRHHGGLATVRAIIGRYVYRSYDGVVVRATLVGPPAADHAGGVAFRRATAADLARLEELDRHGRGAIQRAYVEEGDWLFVACDGDRIVATRRYSHQVRAAPVSRVVALGKRQVWAADVFTLPEYRSQGIGRQRALFADRFLASQGYTELFGSIAASNEPSIRLSLGKGTELTHYISYRRVLFHERVRVSNEALRRLETRLRTTRPGPG
jgi:GNAT superfamily N-acetyltransferase